MQKEGAGINILQKAFFGILGIILGGLGGAIIAGIIIFVFFGIALFKSHGLAWNGEIVFRVGIILSIVTVLGFAFAGLKEGLKYANKRGEK